MRELQGALNRLIALPDARRRADRAGSGASSILGDLAEQRSRATPAARERRVHELPHRHRDGRRAARRASGRRASREGIDYWSGEGYRTGVLERALSEPLAAAERRGAAARVRGAPSTQAARSRAADRPARSRTRRARRVPRSGSPARGRAASRARAAQRRRRRRDRRRRSRAAASRSARSNQLAVRAADAIVAVPGTRYNPLFIHGPSGVGKTHLLNAIGNGLVDAARRRRRVRAGAAVRRRADRGDAGRHGRALARALSRGGRAAARRRAVRRRQGAHAGRAVPRLQRALRGRQAARVRERSSAARVDRVWKNGCARASRAGSSSQMQSPDRALRERLYARFLSELGVEPTSEMLAYLAERPAASVREIIGTVQSHSSRRPKWRRCR